MNNTIQQVTDTVKKAFNWWWASFEMTETEPKNGVLRFIGAVIIGAIALATIPGIILSIFGFISKIWIYVIAAIVLAAVYFHKPGSELSEWIDKAKALFNKQDDKQDDTTS